ncbi:NAD(+)/NADH kinase [Campylobacter canadensis]|uniref:NAD kinase n=1 Tax=Campylobacter canadensis TaxID=449520 RepID=A0ABS7WQN3_9BACT|nr:NAD(+)/NADH kinase [Campylobacter canadensis]MBZ7987091.1 NAD(+)/NADH kinase [Campylobacter canadensis]MBZ7994705.1 NAD(+)/NADH kinase [Campylobacter canadensis]MBZ7996201.1 NAD(+)/NADH kinase [Campylobacter canadensis]MBZ7998127.1 NAD(+)/NADH kinase [Campylobacter canadensis]MBZ7999983.1 NAD(+)/NADH kinase [Campylobacter canadensis]
MQVKKIILFYKQSLEDSPYLKLICEILKSEKIDYILQKNTNTIQKFDLENIDLVISVGGDGNLISACRMLAKTNIPVLGVHCGNLGFLTEVELCNLKDFLLDIKNNNYKIERPFLLSIFIYLNNGQVIQRYAFNDAVLNREEHLLLADIKASFKDKIFNSYHADGLIISTPAGSTAYNLSAGGGIIYPQSRVFSLTPICSHSLTQRPIILPKSFFIELSSKNCSLSIDGQELFKANEFYKISCGLSKTRANILRAKNRSYFQVLKDKLNWGEND